MPSSPSTRLRLEKQNTGENRNTWGQKLNDTGLELLDTAIAGVVSIAVNGAVALSSVNYADDQARNACLVFTGAGGFTVTVPAVEKVYLIANTCAAAVTVTAGATGASILPGERCQVWCDGVDVFKARALDAGSQRLQNGATPTAASDAVPKSYVDAAILGAWTVKSSAYAALAGDRLLCDTSAGAFTVTLPAAPTASQVVEIIDALGTFNTNNLTVGRNGRTIAGSATDLTLDLPAVRVLLVYTGATWAVGAG